MLSRTEAQLTVLEDWPEQTMESEPWRVRYEDYTYAISLLKKGSPLFSSEMA